MDNEIRDAHFLLSSPSLKACPKSNMPEFAFIGRSNVGKSSLINMITNRKSLAKTSSTPGKTKLINFFLVNDTWRLVDLPGYGYAKVSKDQRSEFKDIIIDYIAKRDNLYCVFVLLDTRIEPQDIDVRFINWLGKIGVPFVLVGTKTDKVSRADLHKFEKKYKEILGETWEEFPQMFYTSTVKKNGRSEILNFIGSALQT